MSPEDSLRTGFDPSDRELCPDGACIGVIGGDGRCRECGKASLNTAPQAKRTKAEDAPPPTAVLEDKPREVEGDGFDPTRRELCPDGACIGVIGPDGRCPECGQRAPGGAVAPADPPDHSASDAAEEEDTEAATKPPSAAPDDDHDIESRQLCPDGACVGVIGPNGRCKECGTRAE